MCREILGSYAGGSVTNRAVTQGGQASAEEPDAACPDSSKPQYKMLVLQLGWA